MQFILNLPNGKQIDMSSDILKQMSGEISREDVQERIKFYQETNKRYYDLISKFKDLGIIKLNLLFLFSTSTK